MAPTVALVRLPRSDQKNQHILLRTEAPAKSTNLKLIATEHEHLYHRKIDEAFLKSSQNSKQGTLDDWRSVVRFIFLHESAASDNITEGVGAVAAIDDEVLTITIRRNIGNITQKLGSVTLKQDDEKEEVSFPEWADEAVSAGDELRARLKEAEAGAGQQHEVVKDLERQLDELVKAKKEQENELLQKFATLLNAKKLKIRDLQRLLAGAKIDPERAAAVQSSRKYHSKSPQPSRKGKRKASDVPSMDDDTLMDEDEATDQATDQASDLDEEDRQRRETPQHSDAEASEEGDAMEEEKEEPKGNAAPQKLPSREKEAKAPTPPRTRATNYSAPAAGEDEETDVETDDEL